MMLLSEIAAQTGTDKLTHGYCEVYVELFRHLQHEPVRFMEHGLLSGQSAEMWARWFTNPDARLHFVDINDYGYRSTDPRFHFHWGDAGNAAFMQYEYAKTGLLDVILDDGGHICSQQIDAFDIGWHALKPGGIYVIEDVHSVHCPQLSNLPFTIIERFAKIAAVMQDERGAHGCAAPDTSNPRHSILSIELRRGLIIIRKRP